MNPVVTERIVTHVRFVAAALAAAFILWSVAPIAPAAAQDRQQNRIFEELGRLRGDIAALQRQVSQRGSQPGAGAAVGTERATRFEVRLSQLEDEMRSLTGELENVAHEFRQLNARIDKLVADVDARLTPIERSQGGAPPVGAAPAPGVAALVAPTEPAPAGTAPENNSGTPSDLLFPAPADEAEPPAPVAVAPPPATPEAPPAVPEAAPETTLAAIPPGNPEQQYNFAFDLLRKRDWSGAEGALRAFIEAHPDNELTGNAYYWLAETFYVRSDLEQAAVYFARGYQDFPDSLKASANLLKLGMSLARLGRTDDACLTFQELGERFPDSSPADRQRAAAESRRAGCG